MVVVHGAYTASNLLAGTFLSIFLWRASHDLTPIAIYSGLSAVMIPVAFLANGLVWRRLGAGASIRLGLFGNGLSYLLILLLGTDAPHWVVALGLLRGVSEGFYWSGFHLVSYDTTSDRDRDRYFGVQATASLLLTATLPPAAGAIIVAGTHIAGTDRGYQMVFALSTVVLMAAMVLAGQLPSAARQRLSLRRVATLARRNPDWRWVTRARLADGFTGSLVGLVLTILMFLVLKNEQQVGNFNGLMGLLGVGISLALATFMKPRHRTLCALVGGTMLVLSTLLLPLYLTGWALLAFGLRAAPRQRARTGGVAGHRPRSNAAGDALRLYRPPGALPGARAGAEYRLLPVARRAHQPDAARPHRGGGGWGRPHPDLGGVCAHPPGSLHRRCRQSRAARGGVAAEQSRGSER